LVNMARFCLLRARPRCGLPLSSPVKPAPAWSCLNAGIHHTRNPVLWCSAGCSADNTRGRRGASETKVSGSMRTVLVMVEARPFWSVAATHVLAAAEGWERRSGRASSGFHVLGLRRQCDCGAADLAFDPSEAVIKFLDRLVELRLGDHVILYKRNVLRVFVHMRGSIPHGLGGTGGASTRGNGLVGLGSAWRCVAELKRGRLAI
jgi:hypothetical protein